MMKKILVVVLVVLTTSMAAQEINWMTFDEALEAQAQADNPKKIMVDAYTKWCGPCKLLDRKTFTDKNVIAFVNKNYYPVKFDAESAEEIEYQGLKYANPNFKPNVKGRNSQHHLARKFGVRGYPAIVFLDDNANLINAVTGYRTPQQLEIFLKMIANNDYKTLTTKEAWAEYQKNFKGTF